MGDVSKRKGKRDPETYVSKDKEKRAGNSRT